MKKILSSHFLWVVLISVLVIFAYSKSQKQILAGGGDGWDGISYHALYDQFTGKGSALPVEYPFCKRTGLPYLASRLNLGAAPSFLAINLACGFLAVIFCYLTLAGRYSGITIWACLMPMLFYLFSPVRFSHYYPFNVDPPAMLFYAVAAYSLRRECHFLALMALAVSCFFKETGVYFAVVIPCVLLWLKRVDTRTFLGMLLAALLGFVIVRLIQHGDCSGSQLRQATHNIGLKWSSPMGWLKWVAGLSLTLAPFLIPATERGFPARNDMDHLSGIAASFLVLATIMGLAGGSDTTRIFFIAYPLYVVFLAKLIDGAPSATVVVAMVGGLVANRAFNRIPEPQNYNPDNDVSGFFAYFPDHGHIDGALSLILFWILMQWLARYAARLQAWRTPGA